MYRAGIAPLAAAAAILLGGCHDCTQDRDVINGIELARLNYDSKKFEFAAQLYIGVLERCGDHQEARRGLANAWREHGNEVFRAADQLQETRRPDDAVKKAQEANQFHSDSERLLRSMLQENPKDMMPHYDIGLLWWQRASSPVDFPYARTDKDRRRRDRDTAIGEFKLVVQKVPQAYDAHRYLALALFAADKPEEARDHLQAYHESRQKLYNHILAWPTPNEESRERKKKGLEHVEKEIEEVRGVLMVYHDEVQKVHDRLLSKGKETLNEEERRQLAIHTRELLVLENMIRDFIVINLGPEELALRQRCREYLDAVNKGMASDVAAFVAVKDGEQARVERAIREMLEAGTRYKKINYRSIVVSGETGSVAFECDLVTKKDTRPRADVSLRWRMTAGQWLLVETPR